VHRCARSRSAEEGGWLTWAPLRAVGDRSYGLYLWGTPINFLAYEVYGLRARPPAGGVPVTFTVTEVTYRLIELPLRRFGRRPPSRALASPLVLRRPAS